MNTEALLDDIFQSIFEWDSLPERASITKANHEKWDSMMQLNLVSALESEFDIVIELDDATAIDSYSSALNTVSKYL